MGATPEFLIHSAANSVTDFGQLRRIIFRATLEGKPGSVGHLSRGK
jgi:hypothetical protein